MLLYRKTIQDIPHGLYTLRQAADMPMVPILAQEMVHRFPDTQTEINASEIQTLLIQLTGRFCEHYASDLLCTLTDLDPFLSVHGLPDQDDRWVIGIGLRDSGVDGNTFLLSRLKETRCGLYDYVHPSMVYRKILCLDIQDTAGSDASRRILLKDLTHSILHIHPEDLKEGAAHA